MQRFWWLSAFLHLLILGPLVMLSVLSPLSERSKKNKNISFEVIEKTKEKPAPPPPVPVKVEPVKKNIVQKKIKPKPLAPPSPKPKAPPKEVFGISDDTLTTDTPSPGAVSVKEGNTIVKEVDTQKLEPEDKNREPLPKPKPAFLVSKMPIPIKEKKPVYPPEARSKGIEGEVVLKVLVDQTGKVRAVDVLNDPGYGMGASAKEAMFLYEFEPAQINGNPVPVELPRYVISFTLN